MSQDDNDDAEAGLLIRGAFSKLRQQPRTEGGGLEERQGRERALAGPERDGRSERRTGRTKPLNTKVKPETHAGLERLARKKKTSMGALLDWLVERAVLDEKEQSP